MSRITSCLEALQQQGRKALVPYITAGDPVPELTLPLLQTLVEQGADIIEIGVPFSDPMADGPVIQAASERALAGGTRLSHVLEMVAEFRQQNEQTPIVLMGYLNPFEVMGYQAFAQAAQAAGVDGVLVVDMPPEEAAEWVDELVTREMDPIFLLAPTTSLERVAQISAYARGYLYYVSLKGVTGSKALDVEGVSQRVAEIQGQCQLPVMVGFGIHDATSAQQVAQVADGVVIGSALVQRIADQAGDSARLQSEVAQFMSDVRAALDQC